MKDPCKMYSQGVGGGGMNWEIGIDIYDWEIGID